MANSRKVVLFLILVGILAIVEGNLRMERQRDIDRANAQRVEQQIAADKLSPSLFQLRCGDAPFRHRTYDGFVLSYPAQNVTVAWLTDHGKDHTYYGYGFKRVDYWSMKPLVPIALSEVVQRLGCTPRTE
jgi:hypothetical protein